MKKDAFQDHPFDHQNGSDLWARGGSGVWGGHYVYTFTATSQTQYHTTATKNRHRRPETMKATFTKLLPRLMAPKGAGGLLLLLLVSVANATWVCTLLIFCGLLLLRLREARVENQIETNFIPPVFNRVMSPT